MRERYSPPTVINLFVIYSKERVLMKCCTLLFIFIQIASFSFTTVTDFPCFLQRLRTENNQKKNTTTPRDRSGMCFVQRAEVEKVVLIVSRARG